MRGMGGYRSHFELGIAKSLRQKGVIFEYEKRKVTFVPKPRTYTPDFYFPDTERVRRGQGQVRQERPCEDAAGQGTEP